MSVPTVSYSEATPAGTDYIRVGDNRIRELKTQFREIIAVDHKMDSSGQGATWGYHNQITLIEQANLGTGAEGVPLLGAQTMGGKAELVFTDEDDNDIQLTSGGKIMLDSGRLSNNTNLTGRNAADGADVNILKVNASDIVEFPTESLFSGILSAGQLILQEVAAPTTAANEGGLYTKNDGDQTELYFRGESDGDETQITDSHRVNVVLGAWASKSDNTVYTALTDGFVTAYDSSRGSMYGYSDSSSPPTTVRAQTYAGESEAVNQHIMFPVKKGDYWKTVGATTIQWIPLGT